MNANPLWSAEDLQKATGATLKGEPLKSSIKGVRMDSRAVQPGDLFIAIKGEVQDGHSYIGQAAQNGAVAALVDHVPEGEAAPALSYFVVKDTFEAMRAMARFARNRSKAKVIGITGSVGKTGTRALMETAFGALGAVHASVGSYNNHYGVPYSVAGLPAYAERAVFEMGMNHAGEITPLSKLAMPDLAVITRIAEVHIENFKDIYGIADAKSEIFNGMGEGGMAVLNADDGFYDYLSTKAQARGLDCYSFGVQKDADAVLRKYKLSGGKAHVEADILGEDVSFYLSIPGRHIAINAMAVLLSVALLEGDIRKAAKALSSLQPLSGRGAQVKIRLDEKRNITIIDESYNASPISMRAAFEVLDSFDQSARKIAIVGDMFELGEKSEAYHAELAEVVEKSTAQQVYCCGKLMENLANALPRDVLAGHSVKPIDAVQWLKDAALDGDVILIKGSNGMKLSAIIDALR